MWNYKPCKLINCYYIEKDSITVLTFKNFIKLKGAAMILWMNADGKHTISEIIDKIQNVYVNMEREQLFAGTIKVLKQLQKKGVIIANWDPILKDEIPQEVNLV